MTTRPRYPDPVLQPGPISASREARAADLFRQAQEAMEGGRPEQARALAARVVEEFPSSPVSGRALILLARAELADGAYAAADSAAGRYARLLEAGDPRGARAHLLQADALQRSGDEAARLDRLLLIGPSADSSAASVAITAADQAARAVPLDTLGAVLERTPEDRIARSAVQSVLDERVAAGEHTVRAVHIATVLPTTGSPAFREFAGLIAEGVEVAAAEHLGESFQVDVDARDDQGDPAVAASEVSEVAQGGALGAVGFLESAELAAAGQDRVDGIPLISPTAREASAPGTYTLSGADPRAARDMARYAAQAGLERVAVINSRAPASTEEADAFVAELAQVGVPLAGRFTYDAGATFFSEQIKGAAQALRADEIRALHLGPDDTLHAELLEPVAVFLPIPPEDVELVAPQVTFFGLDTLAIQTLGTSGWTDPETLSSVDTRHTDGVVATAFVDAGPGSAGYARFRAAYERHFQRSLVSTVPALGYDAALLLLDAAATGATSPLELRQALEGLHNVQGATGTFSGEDGRILRRTEVVRIEHGGLIPIGPIG
ncbi:MAG: ABC transporter substrate-binding protein [Gemmatimonadota bacterium]